MKKYLFAFLVFILSLNAVSALAYHDDLDGLLKSHVAPVTKGKIAYHGVDYEAWGKDPRHIIVRDAILNTNPDALESRDEKLAFWINAYNVLTIDLITRENEKDSIKNLGSLFSSPWKKHKWEIYGEEYSLDDIEHKIIRPVGEPRIHFAINCAAKSCPDLRMEAYRAGKLNAQLEDQTRRIFANETKGYKALGGNAVKITKVMQWFKRDFNDGDLNKWLAVYFPDAVNPKTDIKFFNYDWSLNTKKTVMKDKK